MVDEQYLDEKELSQITKRSLGAIRKDRSLNRGIPYVKYGKLVRYRLSDVHKFMHQHVIQTQ